MTRYAWLYLAGSLHPPTCVRVVSCVGGQVSRERKPSRGRRGGRA